jgi:hypothetical protein
MLLCTGWSPSFPADRLPAYCGVVGAERYQESVPEALPEVPFSPISRERGIVITVNTDSDEINGDVSTVKALLANPGSDGISLREAMTATNKNPGIYTIRFDPVLQGAVIKVGPSQLPAIEAGKVIIDGDVDGDNKPDVTIQNNGVDSPLPFGIQIASGDTILYAVAVRGFGVGVVIKPLSTNQTYANIVIANMQIQAVAGAKYSAAGIVLHSGMGSEVISSRNRWINTLITGNTVESEGSGIDLMLHYSAGDRLELTTITNNTVRMSQKGGNGIGLAVGYGAGSDGNRISGVVVAYNRIEGVAPFGIAFSAGYQAASGNSIENIRIIGNSLRISRGQDADNVGIAVSAGFWAGSQANRVVDAQIVGNLIEGTAGSGIGVTSGAVGSSRNRVTKLRISGNQLRLKAEPGGTFGPTSTFGISALVGDGATDWLDPTRRPVVYPEDNQLEDVSILRNSIEGAGVAGVIAGAGCLGARRNSIRNLWVLGNTISEIGFPGQATYGVHIAGAGGLNDTEGKPSAESRISHVAVLGNTIRLKPPLPHNASGGVAVAASQHGGQFNDVSDVQIAYNSIDPGNVIGINLMGGWGSAANNQVSRVEGWCNVVTAPPKQTAPGPPYLKGVSVVGGYHGTKGNRAEQIRLADNLVAGVLDDYSVVPNLEADDSANFAELSDAPKSLLFPQFANGSGTSSEFVLSNPSATTAVKGRLELSDDYGKPLTIGFSGLGEKSSLDFNIPPLGSMNFRTSGQGRLMSGSARVNADGAVAGVVKYTVQGLGTTVLPNSTAVPGGFGVPVRTNRVEGVDTTVVMVNASDQPAALEFVLRNSEGKPLVSGSRTVRDVPSGGRFLVAVRELLPEQYTGDFQGTLTVQVSGAAGKLAGAATEARSSEGRLISLPLIPLR